MSVRIIIIVQLLMEYVTVFGIVQTVTEEGYVMNELLFFAVVLLWLSEYWRWR